MLVENEIKERNPLREREREKRGEKERKREKSNYPSVGTKSQKIPKLIAGNLKEKRSKHQNFNAVVVVVVVVVAAAAVKSWSTQQ